MSRAGRVNQLQLVKMLELLSEDGVLDKGRVTYINITRQHFWKRVTLQLNSVSGGVHKSTLKWCKVWADWKNKTKKKADIFYTRKAGDPGVPLNSLERRLLKIIEYPLEEKIAAFNMGAVSKVEIPEPTSDSNTSPTDGYEAQLKPTPTSSDEEDDTVLESFAKAKSRFCNVNEVLPEEDNQFQFQTCGESSDAGDKVKMKEDDNQFQFQTCGESSDTEDKDKIKEDDNQFQFQTRRESSDTGDKVKMKGDKYKKKKLYLEELKLRTTLALDKERVQQRNEELRLRALELKLKGDELRLKETEMNKISNLTNIEEEKLKCFKEVSSSLKQILERITNGNNRFNNIL